jgi:hypothetical protein
VTVTGRFGGDAAAQVRTINAGGNALANTQGAQLVTATATFGAENSGFNPSTATALPTVSTLQIGIAANWQHTSL